MTSTADSTSATPLPAATLSRLASLIGAVPGCSILSGAALLDSRSPARDPRPRVKLSFTGWSPSLHRIIVELRIPTNLPESFIEASQRLRGEAERSDADAHGQPSESHANPFSGSPANPSSGSADPFARSDDPHIRRAAEDLADAIAKGLKPRLDIQRRRAERGVSIGTALPMDYAISRDEYNAYGTRSAVPRTHVGHLMIDRLLAVATAQRRDAARSPLGVALADAVHNLHRDCGTYNGGPSISDRNTFLKEGRDHATLSYALAISDKKNPDGNYAEIVDGGTISLWGKRIPQSVAAAASGRRLGDLIDTSTIPGSADRIVEHAVFSESDLGPNLVIDLVPDLVPIARIGTLRGDAAITSILA